MITPTFSSFIENDYKMLQKHFDIEKVEYRSLKDILKLFKAIKNADFCYSWFVDIWAFFAVIASKIYWKKSVVVAGGYDVACEPEIAYGQFTRSMIRRFWAKFVLKHADMILPVSDFTKAEVNRRAVTKQLKRVYNGVDTEIFKPDSAKFDIVVTVSSGQNQVAKLKGLMTFVEVASILPDYAFYLLGCNEADKLSLRNVPDNLIVLGHQSQEELIRYYQQAGVYCQLSYRESFGMALAEAMSCGCIPVVTNRGALSEVAGNTGVIIPYGDTNATKVAIEKAFTMDGSAAQERILNSFSLHIRVEALLHIFDFLSQDKDTRIRLQKSVEMANVQSNEKILDLGSGNKILKALLPQNIEYTGVNISEGANIHFDLEEGLLQVIRDRTYDVIFLNDVIEHMKNFNTLISQCRSILSETGRIIISTPSNNRAILLGDEDTE